MEDQLTGRTLGGYRIIRRLGRGGMGAVYEALQESLGRHVALKVLPAALAQDRDFVARFQREAMAAAALKHPGIVQIYDVGEDQGFHFYSMELVEGLSMARYMKERGRVDIPKSAAMIAQVASALEHARKAGIVHRDVKPSNILIERTGRARIVDLGLAKAKLGSSITTRTGIVLGTPHYMAPEQFESPAEVDTRADIYALGITWYHALAGKPPFEGDTPMQICLQHCGTPLPPLTEVRPDVPEQVEKIIVKMTEKRPEDRYQTPAQVVAAIKHYRSTLTGVSAGGPSSGTATQRAQAARAGVQRLGRSLWEKLRRSPLLWSAAAAVLLAAGGLVWVALKLPQGGKEAASAQMGNAEARGPETRREGFQGSQRRWEAAERRPIIKSWWEWVAPELAARRYEDAARVFEDIVRNAPKKPGAETIQFFRNQLRLLRSIPEGIDRYLGTFTAGDVVFLGLLRGRFVSYEQRTLTIEARGQKLSHSLDELSPRQYLALAGRALPPEKSATHLALALFHLYQSPPDLEESRRELRRAEELGADVTALRGFVDFLRRAAFWRMLKKRATGPAHR